MEDKKLTKKDMSENLDLFRDVYCPQGKSKQLSNLLHLWDSIPIYAVSKKKQAQLRTKDTHELPVAKRSFVSPTGEACTISISPARIENKEGVKVDHYPSDTEQQIEEVLRKILMDQQHGHHIQGESQNETWCKFTLSMIRKELKKYNKTRSLDEIKLSLEIMQRSVLEITINKRRSYKGGIILESLISDREDYKINPTTLSAIRFSSLVSTDIDNLAYRQYNHHKTMGLKSQLSRWLFKNLSAQFLNAGFDAPPFTLTFSDIEETSGLFDHADLRKRITQLRGAIQELLNSNNIMKFEEKQILVGRKIIDTSFHITASREFISEMKASNARTKLLNLVKK